MRAIFADVYVLIQQATESGGKHDEPAALTLIRALMALTARFRSWVRACHHRNLLSRTAAPQALCAGKYPR